MSRMDGSVEVFYSVLNVNAIESSLQTLASHASVMNIVIAKTSMYVACAT